MHQFNPVDAAMLFMERPRTPFHVSMVHVYDPSTCPGKPPTYEAIVDAVRKSLPVAPSFRRRIVRVPLDVDYPYWIEDEHFDLEFHVRHLALPRPGDDQQFHTQVARLISRPLDLARPPWEMTVIDGLDSIDGLPSGCFAIVLKIHHCAIDGKAGVALLTALHQDSPRKKPKKVEDTWKPETMPSNRILLRRAWWNSIRRPLRIAQLVTSNASGLVRAAFEDLLGEDEEELVAPPTILNGTISAQRVLGEVYCTLEELKAVRRTVEGATINDVCLSIVAGGMRRYLEAKGALPDQPLITVVPISSRTPEQAKAGGNQIAITRVSLHTDKADPGERLAAISADTRKKKAVQEGVVMSTLLDVVYNLPGSLVGAVARVVPLAIAHGQSFSNTMVTNVPGPAKPFYLLGARAVRMMGAPPMTDGGYVLHSVGSQAGLFLFSFVGCREGLPDADFYRECLAASVREAVESAGG